MTDRASFLLLCLTLLPTQSLAGPRVTDVSPRGLRSGATTTLTIQGSDLLPTPRLVLVPAGSSSIVKPGGSASQISLDVTLPAQTRPGVYVLRLANPKGISNGVTVTVDDLEEVPFTSQIVKLPVALHGILAGGTTLEATFAGKKGQHIMVEIEARRLGSAIEPVLELYDARPVQLAWAQGLKTLGGDARLETSLPADGNYKITLHDMLYQAGSPGAFRLKIGDLASADLIYPLGGQRGTVQNFALIGPGFSPGRQLTIDLRGRNADFGCPLPARPGLTGPGPRIVLGEYPEVMQTLPLAGGLQEISPPAAINGRLSEKGQEDRYRLLVKPGSRWRFDLLASRAGSPLDGVLTIANESGARLGESDDRPDTVDPGMDFTVPEGTYALIAGIRDLLGRGGPEFVYRLSVTPLDRPDFRLRTFEFEHDVPKGGHAIVRVRAERAGYNGPIRLSMRGLPAEINLAGEGIPAGATDALLTLSAAPDGKLMDTFTQLVGESSEPGTSLRRRAGILPTLRPEGFSVPDDDIVLAVTEARPIAIAWEAPPDQLQAGATVPLKVSLKRHQGLAGAIRLALLTSQVVPRTADGKNEDVNRALRLAPAQPISAKEEHASATVVVPGDLPLVPYDLAIRAEFLGADNATVVETAVTPSRRLRVVAPPPAKK